MLLNLMVNAVQQWCRLGACHVQYNVNEYNYLQIFIIMSVIRGGKQTGRWVSVIAGCNSECYSACMKVIKVC